MAASLGEAEISYAGPNAAARARLAAEIITSAHAQARSRNLRFASMPSVVRSIWGDSDSALQRPWSKETPIIRLRFAAQSLNAAEVELLLDEVEALYCAGPAGGAGVRRRTTPRLASASCLIERKFAEPRVTMLGGAAHEGTAPARIANARSAIRAIGSISRSFAAIPRTMT